MVTQRIARRAPIRCLVVAAAVLAGCSGLTGGAESHTWERLPDPPLSPRLGSVAAWTGREVVFVGGEEGRICPPGADCARADPGEPDGAAWDPEAGRWRKIADAPEPIPAFLQAAVVSGVVYIPVGGGILAYDSSADSWSRLSVPEPSGDDARVAADGSRLLLFHSQRTDESVPDQAYDTAAGAWTPLPTDPLTPAFDRELVSTPQGVILTAQDLVANPGSEKPSLTRAALLPAGQARWVLLPDSDQLGSGPWAWSGRRLVSMRLGGADGGEVNPYGRTIPYGGRLDPSTRTWSRLPDAPDERSGGWTVFAPGGPVSAAEGWLYDDVSEHWERLSSPDGALDRPGSAAWVDADTLIVFGGADEAPTGLGGKVTRSAWILRLHS